MNIAVGIPVHDALPEFKKMIDSLFKFTALPFSLFICDDASNKETHDFIVRLPAKKIIVHRKQQWFTRSVNDLLIVSHFFNPTYVFLLNSDIILCENWMEKLLDYFVKDSKVGLVGSLYNKTHREPMETRPPQYVTGHCWVIKEKVIVYAGILNERHVHIESDREYCHRLNNYGIKTILDRAIPINHRGGASWGQHIHKIPSPSRLSKPRKIHLLSDKKDIIRINKKLRLI